MESTVTFGGDTSGYAKFSFVNIILGYPLDFWK
jgi:hypothetical protein